MNIYFTLTSTYVTFPFCYFFLKLVEMQPDSQKAPSENWHWHWLHDGGNKAPVSGILGIKALAEGPLGVITLLILGFELLTFRTPNANPRSHIPPLHA